MASISLTLSLRGQLLSSVRADTYGVGAFTPELVLDFAEDYYRTNNTDTTFDSAITHAATTNATMVGSDGLLKWRPHNLFSYSEDFSNVAWVKDAGVSITSTGHNDPDGGSAATLITVTDNGRLYRNTGITAYNTVAAVFIKAGTFSHFSIFGAFVNLVAKTTTGGTLTELADGWFRFDGPARPITRNFQIQSYPDDAYLTHTTTGTYYLWGGGAYRSDLGGMANNPDRGDSYVPTTTAARYLPRRGHHVYNGTSWVNEGLLHESDARTNLLTNSNGFTTLGASTVTANSGVSPTGETNAVLADTVSASNSNGVFIPNCTINADTSYTTSLYIKNVAGNGILAFFFRTNSASNQTKLWFNLNDGTKGTQGANSGATSVSDFGITEVGNGWYRLYVVGSSTVTTSLNSFIFSAAADNSSNRDGAGEVLIYGAQVEAGSTPSSYIPTAGATVTRAAETLTVPAANMPWPTPVVIGEELVTGDSSTFTSSLGDWAYYTGATASVVDEKFSISGIGTYQIAGLLTVGKVYLVEFDYTRALSSYTPYVGDRASPGSQVRVPNDGTLSGRASGVIRCVFNTAAVGSAAGAVTIDNISVKEIEESVSIQMDGLMTYADTGSGVQVSFHNWKLSSNNFINARLNTQGSRTGQVMFYQRETISGQLILGSSNVAYAPNTNVPFNIASRHGSTFVNGAVDGTALTANTTPPALPDLSTTNFSLAPTYMGTIGKLRVWADDLGDTGIAEASA